MLELGKIATHTPTFSTILVLRNTPGDYRPCQYLHLFERYPHYYCFARRPLKDI